MVEDVEDWGGDVVLFEDARGREQHPSDVERDVAKQGPIAVIRKFCEHMGLVKSKNNQGPP
jgi:hypothetical protein